MSVEIDVNKEIDDLLMSDVWTLEELLPFRKFSKGVISAYMNILADILGISERQARFLANEWAEIAAAVFCDTLFRLQKQGRLPSGKSGEKPEILKFLARCKGLHPGFSRKFRAGFANLIIESYGGRQIDEKNITEPVEVRIEDVVKKEDTIKNEMGTMNNYVNKCSKWLGRRIRKMLMDGIRPNREMPRIAVMYPEYFGRSLMMPGIKWVPINWKESKSDLVVAANKRQELYCHLLDKFNRAIEKIKLPPVAAERPNRVLSDILFAVFIVLAPVNVLDKEILRERLESLQVKLVKIDVRAVISKGIWGNGLLAAAAVGAGLPVISIQMGGGFGVLDLVDSLYEMPLNHFDHYLGFGWKRDKTGLTSFGQAKLHAFSDPGLVELSTLGGKRNLHANRGRIMFSPFVHSFLFRVELWSAYYPENALRIRQEMERFFDIFSRQDPGYKDYEVYVKFKAFNYKIYKEYEYLFGLINYPKNTNVKVLTEGGAQSYFGDVQLHLIDSISTGLMFSLVYNLPTVAYWDKKTQVPTPQAKPIFEQLQECGVLASSAEEMAESAKKLMHYPDEWHRKELQDVRKAYIDGFAKCNTEWEMEFKAVLDKILVKGIN